MKKRDTKDIFAEALLVLAERFPVNKITVKMIVEESGLSAKSFYNHFPDKSSLMVYIFSTELKSIDNVFESPQYFYRDFLAELAFFYTAHRSYLRSALDFTSAANPYIRLHFRAAYEAHLNYILKKNRLSDLPYGIGLSLEMYIFGLLGALWNSLLLNGEEKDTDRLVDQFLENMPEKLKAYI